jgi:hypothetical protein
MVLPIDMSTDPPIREFTKVNVEEAFGKVTEMSKSDAHSVLYELGAPHWIKQDDSGELLEMLILRAELEHDLDDLENLGLEDHYRK